MPISILLLASTINGQKPPNGSKGCGKAPLSYEEGAAKMFKIKMKDRYAVQDKVKRTYRVRLPKGFKICDYLFSFSEPSFYMKDPLALHQNGPKQV